MGGWGGGVCGEKRKKILCQGLNSNFQSIIKELQHDKTYDDRLTDRVQSLKVCQNRQDLIDNNLKTQE